MMERPSVRDGWAGYQPPAGPPPPSPAAAGPVALPVTTMVWLGTVMLLGAIGLAIIVGGLAVGPMEKMIEAETGR
jgi:hypothetical protein